MTRFIRVAVFLVLLLVAFGAGWAYSTFKPGTSVARASLSELERQFTDRMKGVALVGRFTVAGREDRPANPERYEIASVEKVGGDEWRFNARMVYGKIDVTLPITVTMLWA